MKVFTKEELQKVINEKLKGYILISASHREPYVHFKKEGKILCKNVLSGMVTAVDPIMKASKGIWVAYGQGDADRDVVDEKNRVDVPPDNPQYKLKRIFLSETELKNYYEYGNEGLWQMFHMAYSEPIFREKNWLYYQKVNQIYADNILEESPREKKVFVWLQDYPLCLVANNIKKKRPDAIIGIFWHISWPNKAIFSITPQAQDILEGLLGNDLIGFHTEIHCKNFLECVEELIPDAKINWKNYSVKYQKRVTRVKTFPISIDAQFSSQLAKSTEVKQQMDKIPEIIETGFQNLCISVDRGDFIKGIPNKLKTIELFLEKYPEYIGKFVFVQAVQPIRLEIERYQQLQSKIKTESERINSRFSKENYKPIVILSKQLDYPTVLAFYRMADICLVGSLDDGMNLVAKEYITANVDYKGMLVLSRFAGASEELKSALIINPYDVDGYADSIFNALQMPTKEKERRMKKMQKDILQNNIYKWANDFINELTKK